ncbi:MAG: ABC transporter permease [Pseudomonadales bacterium]|nr:ABC transporter permease [Pseudomonadales bacterium]
MNSLFNLRYTLRLLRNSPGTASVAVFIMALGIAVTAPLYAVIKTFGYGTLAVADQDRVMRVMSVNNETGQPLRTGFDNYQFERMRESPEGLEEIAAFNGYRAILSDGDVTMDFIASRVSPSFFSILPANPLLGRTLQAVDEEAGAPAVVVLGYSTWQSYYGGDPDIVGQTSRINGEPHTIIGVMPDGYSYPEVQQLWTTLPRAESSIAGEPKNLHIVAKLDSNTDISEANIIIENLFGRLRTGFTEFYSTESARYVPYTKYLSATSNLSPIGYLFSGVAFMTLLLVSFNLGNLLLVRANERVQELGIRSALGSTKVEMIKEVLRESFVICVTGLLSGLFLAKLVLDFVAFEFNYLLGTEGMALLPSWAQFDLSLEVALFSLGVTLFIWLATGAFSTWRLARQDIGAVIQKGTRSLMGGAGKRSAQLLVGLEITVSTALLVVCGASFVAAANGLRADFGATTENFVVGHIELSASSYREHAARLSYLDDLRLEILEQEGFTDVTFTTAVPGQDGEGVTYALDDRQFDTDTPPRQVQVWVDTNFFELFEVPLREGRWFDSTDVSASVPVVIVDELFAETTWPGESPLGKRIEVTRNQQSEWLQIIGVTSHIIHDNPMNNQVNLTSLYRPLAQSPMNYFRLAVKTEASQAYDLASFSNQMRQAAARADQDVPVLNIHPLERFMQSAMNGSDVMGELLLGIAFVVFSLAIVALFAIVSRSIIARTTEVGIRRALGSTDFKAMSIFIRQGVTHVIIALPVGGGLGIMASSAYLSNANNMGSIIANVSLVVALTITTMVFLASYIPSRKVVTMEPGEALHYE